MSDDAERVREMRIHDDGDEEWEDADADADMDEQDEERSGMAVFNGADGEREGDGDEEEDVDEDMMIVCSDGRYISSDREPSPNSTEYTDKQHPRKDSKTDHSQIVNHDEDNDDDDWKRVEMMDVSDPEYSGGEGMCAEYTEFACE